MQGNYIESTNEKHNLKLEIGTVFFFQLATDNPIQVDDVYSITPQGALVIRNVQSAHQGTYTCIAENALGSVEASADVLILGRCYR